MSNIACTDDCTIELDLEQVEEIYDSLSTKLYDDMDKQYKEGKISGSTYAATWAELMKQVINGSLNAVISLQTKETAMDRCVKQEQCDSSKAKTSRDDELADKNMEVSDKDIDVKDEQITSSQAKTVNETCMATADCALKTSQKSKFDFEVSNILPQQEKLTKRQIIGFDDNKFIKGFNAGMSGWALGFSSGLMGTPQDTGFPAFITSDELSQTYNELMTNTSV